MDEPRKVGRNRNFEPQCAPGDHHPCKFSGCHRKDCMVGLVGAQGEVIYATRAELTLFGAYMDADEAYRIRKSLEDDIRARKSKNGSNPKPKSAHYDHQKAKRNHGGNPRKPHKAHD